MRVSYGFEGLGKAFDFWSNVCRRLGASEKLEGTWLHKTRTTELLTVEQGSS
jgi:hypothetical protein